MKLKHTVFYCLFIIGVIGISSFSTINYSTITTSNFQATPYKLVIPSNFPEMPIPKENPLTVEGVALGRKLFYEPLLSGNNKISCASCHQQKYAFSDSSAAFSTGVNGIKGKRNAMPLFNLAWTRSGYFWDGRSTSLELQAMQPIQNTAEMHESVENAVAELQNSSVYLRLFKKAFGSPRITAGMIADAIAQFERTIISGNSRYDRYIRKESGSYLTAEELKGLNLFLDKDKGNCNPCHALNSVLISFTYNDIGLDSIVQDSGRYAVSLAYNEIGRFKVPSLRNIALTGPYMHDGRFQTLEQVLDHYNEGFRSSANLEQLIFKAGKNKLSATEKENIIKFLKTLTDYDLVTNPKFSNPN